MHEMKVMEGSDEKGLPDKAWTMLPSSPNWYCANIAAWSKVGVFAFACKNTISLLNVASRSFCGEMNGHSNRVTAIEIAARDQGEEVVISGSADRSVRVWSLASQSCLASTSQHKAEVTALATSAALPNTVISGDKKGILVRWCYLAVNADIQTCKLDAPITALACCPHTGSQVVVGFQTGRLVMVDVATMTVVRELIGHDDEVQSIKWSSIGNHGWIATSSRDKLIRIWSPADGTLHCVFRAKQKPSKGGGAADERGRGWTSVGWHGASRLLSSSPSGNMLVWQVPQAAVQKEISKCTKLPNAGGHSRVVFSISPSPTTPNIVVTTGMDRYA